MLVRVRRILEDELTPKQREALVLLGLQDMPMEEAAKRMKTNRNALYKLLHDARLRLKTPCAGGSQPARSVNGFRTKVRLIFD